MPCNAGWRAGSAKPIAHLGIDEKGYCSRVAEERLKTARALQETALRLFDYRRESVARTFFEQWQRLKFAYQTFQEFLRLTNSFLCGRMKSRPALWALERSNSVRY